MNGKTLMQMYKAIETLSMYVHLRGLQADRLVCTHLTILLLQSVVHVVNADDTQEAR